MPDYSAGAPANQQGAELDDYIGRLEVACAEQPDSADLHTCLGVACAARKQFTKARAAFEQALNLAPSHFFARLRYAELLCDRRFLRQAEEHARRAKEAAATKAETAMVRRLIERLEGARAQAS